MDPEGNGQWADHNPVFRNTPAFAGLILLGAIVVRRKYHQWVFVGVGGIATLLEVAQIWIPKRAFDPWDIGASWLGVLLAGMVVGVWNLALSNWFESRNKTVAEKCVSIGEEIRVNS